MEIEAQPQLQVEYTEFNYGKVVEGTDMTKRIRITNSGDQPLVISRASTSDGGSMARAPREPILPDSSDYIVFYYDSKRIGPFTKSINIESNATQKVVMMRGEITRKPTTVKVIEIGSNNQIIPFNTMTSLKACIINTGNYSLYFSRLYDPLERYKPEILYVKLAYDKQMDSIFQWEKGCDPGDSIFVEIALRNILGDVGYLSDTLHFNSNTIDPLQLVVRGKFIGAPSDSLRLEQERVFTYEKGELVVVEEFNIHGVTTRIDHFKNGLCFRSVIDSWQHYELLYEEGVFVERILLEK